MAAVPQPASETPVAGSMKRKWHLAIFCCEIFLASLGCYGQAGGKATLLSEIQQMPAIDNHAHAVCPPSINPGDGDFDALPVDNLEPESEPVLMKPSNRTLPLAWKALFGFSGDAATPIGLRQLQRARDVVRKAQKINYSVWVLNQSHIETVLANRVAMCEGISKPRFAWVLMQMRCCFH